MTAEIRRFDDWSEMDAIRATMQTDGAAIVVNAMTSDFRSKLQSELDPWIVQTPAGRDDFTGRLTSRTGALVARSPLSRELVMDAGVLEAARSFLDPYTNKIQLHLTQVITIGPGQGSQPLHRDRLAWGGYIPREIEPQFNTLWALTDFTAENGATRVVPGSVSWEDARRASDGEITQAEMAAGSVLLYTGSVIHGGGENRSDTSRSGINITYCLAWLRTEENQFLSCPPEIAQDLDADLTDLMGYSMGNYALGYYSVPGTVHPLSDITPPEVAVGRMPTR